MAQNETNTMTSHNLLNYSGLLFNKGNTRTPFSTLIGGKSRKTNAWKFATSLAYETKGGTAQPEISESASKKAPAATFVTREQNTNVCQIFQEALSMTYAKASASGQLSGLNFAGQKENPADELDFQVAQAMKKIANDIEYTFLNGVYQDGTHDDVAYKTRGILNAISTNNMEATGQKLGYWLLAELISAIYNSNSESDGLVLQCAPTHIMQLNADAAENGLTIVESSRERNGIRLTTLKTPFGDLDLSPNARVPLGTALVFNPEICSPVEMDVPKKGNFFLEPLAKTGAADDFQIYGQLGLDYGAEWAHGKITGLDQAFTAPGKAAAAASEVSD